jgi:hypothetical protein
MNRMKIIPITKLVLICALVTNSAQAEQSVIDAPILVGMASFGEKTHVVLVDRENKGMRWVPVGGKFGDFEVLAYDNKSETALLARGKETFTLKIKDSKVVSVDPDAQRAASLEAAGHLLSAYEKTMRAKPGYRTYDPTYEARLTPMQKQYLDSSRQKIEGKGGKLYVVEQEYGPHFVASQAAPSSMKSVVKVLPGLTPTDWSTIDEKFRILTVEGQSAPPEAAKKKWEEMKAAKAAKVGK